MTVYRGTILSSATGGAYAVSNDLIGQLKTILLNSGVATVLNDNNAGPTACRYINLVIGNSAHYLQLASTDVAGSFYCNIINLANTNNARGVRFFSSGNTNAVAVLLLTGAHSFAFSLSGNFAPFWVMGSDSRWYACYPSYAYSDDSDLSINLLSPNYGVRVDSSGKAVASQYAISSGSVLYAYLKCLWFVSTDASSYLTAFADQNGVNYVNFTTGMFISDD